MSVPLTPSKRPNDRSLVEPNGKGKWQKTAGTHLPSQPLKVSPGSVVFRLLCPATKIGSVIGKGGSIISEIRQETGVKVKVEETIPGCDERVVTITGPDKETEEDTEQNKEVCSEETDNKGKGDETKNHSDNNEDKDSAPVEDSNCEKGTSSVQKALLLVFERMVEGEEEPTEGDGEDTKSSFVLRLLVLSNQVGCLLGKGGSVIKQMSADSGAQIRILPRDKLPLCASASDELVQVTLDDTAQKSMPSLSITKIAFCCCISLYQCQSWTCIVSYDRAYGIFQQISILNLV